MRRSMSTAWALAAWVGDIVDGEDHPTVGRPLADREQQELVAVDHLAVTSHVDLGVWIGPDVP
jgi:hypothetical protein